MRPILLAFLLLASGGCLAQSGPVDQTAAAELQRLDATAFDGFDQVVGGLADIQSVVVLLQGRVAYQYHRDGNPDTLRDVQSVAKSALVALAGTALQHGQLASLDQPVLQSMPAWKALNPDPRAGSITLRHLLSMTAGFGIDDAPGTAAPLPPERAWARPMRAAPGQAFQYDNSSVLLAMAVLEQAGGRPWADLAADQLVQPLGMAQPSYRGGLHLRTVDMARLGQLFLQDGRWGERQLLPPGFAALATQPASPGGPPVQMPYALSWWVPSSSTYFASGYAGQFIWVHPPLGLVAAVTSTVSPASQRRGQAMQLIRGRLFQAAQVRMAAAGR